MAHNLGGVVVPAGDRSGSRRLFPGGYGGPFRPTGRLIPHSWQYSTKLVTAFFFVLFELRRLTDTPQQKKNKKQKIKP